MINAVRALAKKYSVEILGVKFEKHQLTVTVSQQTLLGKYDFVAETLGLNFSSPNYEIILTQPARVDGK